VGAPFNVLPQGATDVVAPLVTYKGGSRGIKFSGGSQLITLVPFGVERPSSAA